MFLCGATAATNRSYLKEVNGSFQIYGHWSNGIERVYMPSLVSVSSSMTLEYNYAIQELDFSSLTEIGGQFYYYYNRDLDVLEISNLEEVGSNFYLYYSTNLDSLDLDSLTDIGGSMTINYNTSIPIFIINTGNPRGTKRTKIGSLPTLAT